MIYFEKLFIGIKLETWCVAKMHFAFDGFMTVCSLVFRGNFILPSTVGSVLLVRNLRKQLLGPHMPRPERSPYDRNKILYISGRYLLMCVGTYHSGTQVLTLTFSSYVLYSTKTVSEISL